MTDWRVIGRRSGGVEVKKRQGKLDGRETGAGRRGGARDSKGKDGKTEEGNAKGWSGGGGGWGRRWGDSPRRGRDGGDETEAAGAESERIKTASRVLTQHCARHSCR